MSEATSVIRAQRAEAFGTPLRDFAKVEVTLGEGNGIVVLLTRKQAEQVGARLVAIAKEMP